MTMIVRIAKLTDKQRKFVPQKYMKDDAFLLKRNYTATMENAVNRKRQFFWENAFVKSCVLYKETKTLIIETVGPKKGRKK